MLLRRHLVEQGQPNEPIGSVFGDGALPFVATKVSSSPDSYVYLAESIQAWPDQQALATVIRRSGWEGVEYRNLSGGIVALHRAAADKAPSTTANKAQ